MRTRLFALLVLALACGSLTAAHKRQKPVTVLATLTGDALAGLADPGFVWVQYGSGTVNNSTATFKLYDLYYYGVPAYRTVPGAPGPIRVESATDITYYVPIDLISVDNAFGQPDIWVADPDSILIFNLSAGTYNTKAGGAGVTVTLPGASVQTGECR